MIRRLTCALLAAMVVAGFGVLASGRQVAIPRAAATWQPETLGNHRAIVRVAGPSDAVRVHVEWRRRDADPDRKDIIVTDSAGKRMTNVVRVAINREAGDLVFEPASGPGDYYVYYMPMSGEGRANYPKVTYPAFQETADATWVAHVLGPDFPLAISNVAAPPSGERGRVVDRLPQARVVEFQSNGEFDSFAPMEIIATAAETSRLVAAHPQPFLLFPEDRHNPIRMTDDLPLRWIGPGPNSEFKGRAQRGEFYVFQIGVFPPKQALEVTKVTLTGLEKVAGTSFRCINLGGVNSEGARFTRTVSVAAGKVQALWCGLQVPENAQPNNYRGQVAVAAKDLPDQSFPFNLTIDGTAIRDAGDDEPARLSRLRWLDSTLAMDDEVVKPYTPITVDGSTLGILGRKVVLGSEGLPDRIESYFAPEMTRVSDSPRQMLAAPVAFAVLGLDGKPLLPKATKAGFVKRTNGTVGWASERTGQGLRVGIRGQLEFDGTVDYQVSITTEREMAIGDVRLEIPVARDVARYMMGMGLKGGLRPATFDWKWNVERNQDSAWIGDVNAGLQLSMRDERYVRPLNTNFYQLKRLVMPRSWDNGGKGGCRFVESGDRFLVTCFSGPRTLQPNDPIHYNFRLLITPFHTLDTRAQWTTRFFHAYKPLDEVATTGANTLNIHHANEINPYINYPFLRVPQMKAYIDDAHRRGYKVKIYYTVRELSNRTAELFALRSLGDEVLIGGPGGGPSWLQEHVGTNYIAGWYVPALKDAAIVTSGVSRWHNYYVEGLNWLVKNVGIDGLYIDDVAFDRTTMKRVRKVLERGRPGSLIDLHSANQFNIRDGFANSANLYLEHFPYLDRLWFGEYFDYNSRPDFWMVEMAGIPFGLMGEMLQDGGNPWRGMIYGMTNRLPWTTSSDPRPLWKFWDSVGMQDTEMIGYWVAEPPVKTDRPDVLATTYTKRGTTVISVASWAKDPVQATLAIDWRRLGLDPSNATITAPAIEKFQEARSFKIGETIPIEPGRGWLLVVR